MTSLRSLGLAAEGLPTILDGGRQTRGRQTVWICAEVGPYLSLAPDRCLTGVRAPEIGYIDIYTYYRGGWRRSRRMSTGPRPRAAQMRRFDLGRISAHVDTVCRGTLGTQCLAGFGTSMLTVSREGDCGSPAPTAVSQAPLRLLMASRKEVTPQDEPVSIPSGVAAEDKHDNRADFLPSRYKLGRKVLKVFHRILEDARSDLPRVDPSPVAYHFQVNDRRRICSQASSSRRITQSKWLAYIVGDDDLDNNTFKNIELTKCGVASG
ncbi:hypothetical protein GGX14DRAFT_601063 [Mycena pura]|uniref:Uncharacterized protein n=1 Tax=Mycena pura TaxID=153505 RepID=A0AAD6UVC4_9AGAR|nr:hypothetical protein GGX14DRAFT_601063 [Mycena pura]